MNRRTPRDFRRYKPREILAILLIVVGAVVWKYYFGPETSEGEQAILESQIVGERKIFVHGRGGELLGQLRRMPGFERGTATTRLQGCHHERETG